MWTSGSRWFDLKDEESSDVPPSIGSKVNENSQCTNFFIKSNVEKKCQDYEDSSRMQEGVETQVDNEETNQLQEDRITSGSRWANLEDEEYCALVKLISYKLLIEYLICVLKY